MNLQNYLIHLNSRMIKSRSNHRILKFELRTSQPELQNARKMLIDQKFPLD